MPCKARIDAPGALQHIIIRTIERKVRVTPRMKARTALLRDLKEVFGRYQSQPVDRVI